MTLPFFFCKLMGSHLHISLNRYASAAGKLERARNHMSSNKDKKMQKKWLSGERMTYYHGAQYIPLHMHRDDLI